MRWSKKIDSSGNHGGHDQRQTDMIRSRRLALVAIVISFGIASCGDPTTTTPLADRPKVIQLASGTRASGGAAPTAAAADSAETKMAVFGPIEYTYAGDLPALDGPSASWYFSPGQKPDPARIAKLAAALGVEGEVRTLAVDQGGGWAVGPTDYSAPVLSVGGDGLLTWYLSAAPTAVGSGCATTSGVAVAPASGAGVAGSSATANAVAAPSAPTPDTAVPPAPDAVVPECQAPQPPPGVPTKDEALAKAKDLFASLGYDLNSYAFDNAYADEWSASVNASLVLDGMKTQVMLSVGYGENGAITWASGSFATPQSGGDYPTIGAAAGLERLKTQQSQYLGLGGGPATRSATVDVAAQPALGAPAIAPCEAGPATDCAPVSTDPVIVTLDSVKRDLTMIWAADNTIWLLPAYTFGSADGGIYTVNAVDDAYLQQAAPDVATTEPVIHPDTVVPPPDVAPACAPVTTMTVPAASVQQIADAMVGYCLVAAQELAKTFGYEVRVVRQDGVDLVVTADFSESRINVAVDGQAVTSVVSIG
jgi:hypothetical protein